MNIHSHVQAPPMAPLEKLSVAFDEASSAPLLLDEAARRYLGCEQRVDVSRLEQLGPVVRSPGPRVPLGKWLATQAHEQPGRGGFWGLSLADGSWIDVVAMDGEMTLFLDRRSQPTNGTVPYSALAHRMRNQLNAIQMNAELLEMLTKADGNTQIGRAAERVLKNARLLRQTLDTVQDDATDMLDLAETLQAELFRRGGSRLVVDDDIQIPASRSYCSNLLDLLAQWLVFGEASAGERVRLVVVAETGTISIETPGLRAWVTHSLAGMAEWLRGDDVASAPTRVFRVYDLGCGYWRDGPAAGADVGYRSLSP